MKETYSYKYNDFGTKKKNIEYINKRLRNFTRAQKRDSGLSGLWNMPAVQVADIVDNIRGKKLKAVTTEGKEIIATPKELRTIERELPYYSTKIKKGAEYALKTGRRSKIKEVDSLAVHLTTFGFSIDEALWLVSKYGMQMSGWISWATSDTKAEIFNPYNGSEYVDRYTGKSY